MDPNSPAREGVGSPAYQKHNSIEALRSRGIVRRTLTDESDKLTSSGAIPGGANVYEKHASLQEVNDRSLVRRASTQQQQQQEQHRHRHHTHRSERTSVIPEFATTPGRHDRRVSPYDVQNDDGEELGSEPGTSEDRASGRWQRLMGKRWWWPSRKGD
mmetsp:Transcript_92496/g.270745  ORF Transcript_92496/g.270745 Transcript_92496/m.270745 type:complete len:158 (+) Transcript_92496:39-512(+)